MANIFTNVFSIFSACSMAIDLGTVNTLLAIRGYGIVLEEASAVAVSTEHENEIYAVGNDAVNMFGRTPCGLRLRFPFRRGVIADYTLAEYMIRSFMEKAAKEYSKTLGIFGTKVLLCVPGCVTEVERRALEEAAKHAGARDVLVMEEALAACIGAGLPFSEPTASMIADIGGGTTDVAVVTLGGIAAQRSIRIGGNNMDDEIVSAIRRSHNILIGSKTAERLKIAYGLNMKRDSMTVRGLSLANNLPESAEINAAEINIALDNSIRQIVFAIRDVMASTPPELAGDIMKNGLTLTGGGAMLCGLKEKLERELNIPVQLAGNPLQTVALGALKALETLQTRRDIEQFKEYPTLVNQ